MKFLRELLVGLFFIAASAAMTWPLLVNLDRAIAVPGDPYGLTWVMDWDYYAIAHRLPLFQAPIFHPSPNAFAFSEHMFGVALLFFPLFAMGIAPLTVHNLAVLLGFAACGYAACLLGRWCTRSTLAGMAAGVAYAFVGFRFHHLSHVQLIWSAGLPLLLLAVLAFAKTPTWKTAAWFSAALVFNGLTSNHWLAFGTVAGGITVVIVGARARRDRRFWLQLAAATALALIVLLPFITPYRTVSKTEGMVRSAAEATANSARWRDWLEPNYQNRLYGRLAEDEAIGHERTLFPGACVFLLAGLGLFRRRDDNQRLGLWAAIIWIAIGAAGARGMRGWFHALLFHAVSGFRGIRMPVRWVMIAYVGLSLLVAMGVALLIEKRGPIAKAAIGTAIIAAMLFELRVAPIRWFLVPLEPRPLYAWLRDVPIRGAIVELPMTQDGAYEYLWRSTVHHRPLINGVSSYLPRDYERLLSLYDVSPIDPTLLDELTKRGCSLVVVHEAALRERTAPIRDWLRREVAAGRLQFVRRFDAGVRADYVFAVAATEPQSSRWRAPEVPDPSGRTPAQNAQLFLDTGGRTYSADIMTVVDQVPMGAISGKLTISGWATAPAGIDRVELRLANGRIVTRADSFPRPDLVLVMPWYRNDDRAGFRKTFELPPDGIDGDTDLQLEVFDRQGASRRTAPFWFCWKKEGAAIRSDRCGS